MNYTNLIRVLNKLTQLLVLEIRLTQQGRYERAVSLLDKKEDLLMAYEQAVEWMKNSAPAQQLSPAQREIISQKQDKLDQVIAQSHVTLKLVMTAHEDLIEEKIRTGINVNTHAYNNRAKVESPKMQNVAINKQM